jgi:hypothetical protein
LYHASRSQEGLNKYLRKKFIYPMKTLRFIIYPLKVSFLSVSPNQHIK